MPGGFGTLDEAFEVLTLIQCHKLNGFPIVAMGCDFWLQLRTFVRGALINEKTISPEDLDLLHVTDDTEDAVRYITGGVARNESSPKGID
jgi:predicted Rossmann-fold nucleotide-binding protein